MSSSNNPIKRIHVGQTVRLYIGESVETKGPDYLPGNPYDSEIETVVNALKNNGIDYTATRSFDVDTKDNVIVIQNDDLSTSQTAAYVIKALRQSGLINNIEQAIGMITAASTTDIIKERIRTSLEEIGEIGAATEPFIIGLSKRSGGVMITVGSKFGQNKESATDAETALLDKIDQALAKNFQNTRRTDDPRSVKEPRGPRVFSTYWELKEVAQALLDANLATADDLLAAVKADPDSRNEHIVGLEQYFKDRGIKFNQGNPKGGVG